MRLGLILLILLAFLDNYAQDGIKLDRDQHDYGSLDRWTPKPLEFKLTNNGTKNIYILPTRSSRDLRVEHTRQAIAPAQTTIIRITYYSDQIGPFTKEVKLYTSASQEPVMITLKGEILSIAPGAVVECPPVSGQPEEELFEEETANSVEYILRGKVTDKLTRQPIPNTRIELVKDSKVQYTSNTPTDGTYQGKITPGDYLINVSASGYIPQRKRYTINNTLTTINFRLESIVEQTTEIMEKPVEIVKEEKPEEKVELALEEDGDLPSNLYSPNNLIFLIDVSLSMGKQDKLTQLKIALKKMISALRDIDYVTIITYKNSPKTIIENANGTQKELFYKLIDELEAGGLTNGLSGLTEGYQIARNHYIDDGNNQIIISTDGLITSSISSAKDINKLVNKEANERMQAGKIIKLSVVGFGNDPEAVVLMQDLAAAGSGNFIHIKDNKIKEEVLLEEIKSMSRINH